eukprot:4026183-Prorocentrum_lima.AAC.1
MSRQSATRYWLGTASCTASVVSSPLSQKQCASKSCNARRGRGANGGYRRKVNIVTGSVRVKQGGRACVHVFESGCVLLATARAR